MDSGGDVSLAIRRARRSGAKRLDLSQRGLRAWPEGIFALRQLEELDVSGNELTSVDPSLSQLEMLQELNLSNNNLDSLNLDVDALQHLRSVILDGNPLASRESQPIIRQLATPLVTPGQTHSQMIRTLLSSLGKGSIAPRPPRASASRKLTGPLGTSESMGISRIQDCSATQVEAITMNDDAKDVQAEIPSRPSHNLLDELDLDKLLAPKVDAAAPWRKEQKVMLKEVEQLRSRVQELEEQLSAANARIVDKATERPPIPSWLQQESKHANSLNTSLPSRRCGFTDDDETAVLKEQMREEQSKRKRLETEVKRLSARLNESDLKKGSVGSVPHFEFSEVEVGDIINQGGFSVVHKGCWHTTNIAIKKLFDPNINEELLAEFDNEVQKLEQIRHPNILMLLAVHRKPPALSIITELVEGGSFFQLLHSPSNFNSASGPLTGVSHSESMAILDCTATAIAFLHGRGIAHRDVKSQNVLLSPTMIVKLCDFGLARMRSELMTGRMQFAGTPNYMAPEIFRNQKYTENVDVFAFGTLLWEAMAVDIPFANFDAADIRDRVIKGEMLPMPVSTPLTVQAIINGCWTMDRNTRPTMADILLRLRKCAVGE